MPYFKEARNLSEGQAIDNLLAIVRADYFKPYEISSGDSRLNSDLLRVESLGGWRAGTIKPYTVGDLSDVLVSLLGAIRDRGTLHLASLQLRISQKEIKAMGFERKLYVDEDFGLPLSLSIVRGARSAPDKYLFTAKNLGLKESYFESAGLDLKDANQRLFTWYRQVARQLTKILPHPVQNMTFP